MGYLVSTARPQLSCTAANPFCTTSTGSSPPRAAPARTPKEGRYQAPYPTAIISKPGQGCLRWLFCATRYFFFSLQALRRNVEKSLPIDQLQLGTDMQPFVGK